MAPRDSFAEYCAELLAPAGPVRVRRMFGGHGVYLEDLFVAIVSGERLYLKADAQTAPAFERAGGTRFAYEAKGRAMALQFWTPPADAMDSPRLMEPWARLATQAALRARAGPPAAAKRPRAPARRAGR